MLLLTIPKPCHEDWSKMTPVDRGAFCNACSKIVVDFSTFSNEEIKNYFMQHRHESICGHFKTTRIEDNPDLLPTIMSAKLPLWKKFLAAVVILFGSLFTSCKQPATGNIVSPATIIQVSQTAISNINIPDERITGADTLRVEGRIAPCTITTGELIATEIQGGMEMVEQPYPEQIIDIAPAPELPKEIEKKKIIDKCTGLDKDSVIILIP